MATQAATVVIDETGNIEHLRMEDTNPLSWLRGTLKSDTVDHIALGPQMRLYYDPESTNRENPVASEMLSAYPTEAPIIIRGTIAVCRWDQRTATMGDLFVAQVDRISERFLRDIVSRKQVCSLSIDSRSGSIERINIPPGSSEAVIAQLLAERNKSQTQSRSLSVDRLQGEIVMVSIATMGWPNLAAQDLFAAFVNRAEPFISDTALVCREDPNTGMYTDLMKEQLDRVMIVFNAMPNYYRSMGYFGTGRPEQRWTNSEKGELGFRFDTDN
ncbi:hypothetical protein ACQPXH_20510 [Nocardia sp. CA-135953]|uniref:hypothetical protein n=1 Tax=Nocardia sp. CA-135953 TaxID=3239978 RepID=UPI003D9A0873